MAQYKKFNDDMQVGDRGSFIFNDDISLSFSKHFLKRTIFMQTNFANYLVEVSNFINKKKKLNECSQKNFAKVILRGQKKYIASPDKAYVIMFVSNSITKIWQRKCSKFQMVAFKNGDNVSSSSGRLSISNHDMKNGGAVRQKRKSPQIAFQR